MKSPRSVFSKGMSFRPLRGLLATPGRASQRTELKRADLIENEKGFRKACRLLRRRCTGAQRLRGPFALAAGNWRLRDGTPLALFRQREEICVLSSRSLYQPIGLRPRAQFRGTKLLCRLAARSGARLDRLLWKESSSADLSIHRVRLNRTASGLRSSRRDLEAKRKEQHVRQISQSSSIRVCASRLGEHHPSIRASGGHCIDRYSEGA